MALHFAGQERVSCSSHALTCAAGCAGEEQDFAKFAPAGRRGVAQTRDDPTAPRGAGPHIHATHRPR
eukprot:2199193-Prymnesium_polylepis.1